jgi:hypothetical protein
MIVRFHDRAYLHIGSRWFVWEPVWSLFRPVDGLAWNGATFVLDDTAYCADITDRQYGFGSEEMYQVCTKLSETWADKVADAPVAKVLTIGKNEWFFDRPMVLTSCAPRTKESWRAMGLQRKSLRVLRRSPRKTFTKRNQV